MQRMLKLNIQYVSVRLGHVGCDAFAVFTLFHASVFRSTPGGGGVEIWPGRDGGAWESEHALLGINSAKSKHRMPFQYILSRWAYRNPLASCDVLYTTHHLAKTNMYKFTLPWEIQPY